MKNDIDDEKRRDVDATQLDERNQSSHHMELYAMSEMFALSLAFNSMW